MKKYNNKYCNTIKMRPVDAKSSTYIDFTKENRKDPEFKVGDHVRILKDENIFENCYLPNCSEEVFLIKEVKNTVPWTYVGSDLNRKEIVGTFYEKE